MEKKDVLSLVRYCVFGNLVSTSLRKPSPINICTLNYFMSPTNAKWPAMESQTLHSSVSPGDPEQENTVPPTSSCDYSC